MTYKKEEKMKLGIDMGGMSIKMGLVNEENEIIGRITIPTDLTVPYQMLVERMADAVQQMLENAGMTLEQCEGIGIGSPGTIDAKRGVILYSNNFGWENVPIVEELKKHLDVGIEIANDADAAALGEVYAGAAEGAENAVLLTLGTGVGSGVILDKKIFRGGMPGGCELGHLSIHHDGVRCTCGSKGCLEAYASASALLRIAREKAAEHPESVMNEMCKNDLEQMNGKIPFDAAKAGDEAGMEVIKEYEGYLACGIANVINTFRPEKVILGGGVAAQKENLTAPLKDLVKDMCFGGSHGYIADIVTSALGNDAGIIGAANLVV